MSQNKRVQIVEVGPRDGLQHERVWVSTQTKVAYINALARSGLRRIEVTSFVHPSAVPQLVDAEKVLARIDRPEGVSFSALVPNMHGFERAQPCNLDEIAVFTGATDSFVRRNINMSIDESIAAFRPVVDASLAALSFSLPLRCVRHNPMASTFAVVRQCPHRLWLPLRRRRNAPGRHRRGPAPL